MSNSIMEKVIINYVKPVKMSYEDLIPLLCRRKKIIVHFCRYNKSLRKWVLVKERSIWNTGRCSMKFNHQWFGGDRLPVFQRKPQELKTKWSVTRDSCFYERMKRWSVTRDFKRRKYTSEEFLNKVVKAMRKYDKNKLKICGVWSVGKSVRRIV